MTPMVLDVRKHAAPIHPGTGTTQEVHGRGAGGKETTTAGKPSDPLPSLAEIDAISFSEEAIRSGDRDDEFWASLRKAQDRLKAAEANGVDTQAHWDAISQKMDERRAFETKFHGELRRQVTLGEITPEEADELGLRLPNDDVGARPHGIEPLPDRLFHVTTDRRGIEETGIKTRDELEMGRGAGLGGGPSDTISFTGDRSTADAILRSMEERWEVLNDPEAGIERLVEEAKTGAFADREFWEHSGMSGKWTPENLKDLKEGWGIPPTEILHGRDPLRGTLEGAAKAVKLYDAKQLSRGHAARWTGEVALRHGVHMARRNPAAHAEALGDFMDEYAWHREGAGGLMNPLFFSTDDLAFSQVPKSSIQVLTFASKPNTFGHRVSSLGEWRVWSGDAVELVDE